MAQLFQITVPQGMSSVKLDSQGRAIVQFTAKNVSATSIDGKGVLASFPRTSPASGAVENGWVKIDGPPERHFDKDREETFAVKITVPPKSKPGTYGFRLNVVSVARPDEGDYSATVGFEVAAPTVTTGGGIPKWLLIVLVVVLVLAVGGVGTWLIVRKPAGTTTQTTPAQTQPATQSSGEPMVTVPRLIGQPIQAVPAILGERKLTVGVTTPLKTGAAPGVVVQQGPYAGATVRTGTAINLWVEPQPNPLPYGPDTCKPGFVWREAVPNDHVCVIGAVRTQTAQDNALAGTRRNPGGGPYGPDTCIQGFVWREAVPNDHVCVPGQTRDQAASDNAQAASRKMQP